MQTYHAIEFFGGEMDGLKIGSEDPPVEGAMMTVRNSVYVLRDGAYHYDHERTVSPWGVASIADAKASGERLRAMGIKFDGEYT